MKDYDEQTKTICKCVRKSQLSSSPIFGIASLLRWYFPPKTEPIFCWRLGYLDTWFRGSFHYLLKVDFTHNPRISSKQQKSKFRGAMQYLIHTIRVGTNGRLRKCSVLDPGRRSWSSASCLSSSSSSDRSCSLIGLRGGGGGGEEESGDGATVTVQ